MAGTYAVCEICRCHASNSCCGPYINASSFGCMHVASAQLLIILFHAACNAAASNGRLAAQPSTSMRRPDQRPFLHGLFHDNMVLCRNRRGSVFGWARSGTRVTVTLRRQSNNGLVRTAYIKYAAAAACLAVSAGSVQALLHNGAGHDLWGSNSTPLPWTRACLLGLLGFQVGPSS